MIKYPMPTTQLNIEIENLISQNAEDFEIAKLIKKEIKEYLGSLDEIFNTTQGKDFFVKHTKRIDGFITIIYKYLLRKHFSEFMPMSNSIPLTIIALGSYGREQLCVYSDIDLMILYKEIPGFNLKPIMEEFMILAWDCGLKLGSRVHEINEIETAVREDITIKTSILESRIIYGSKLLWFQYQNKLTAIRDYQRKEFIEEKFAEHKQRLLKYPLDMQPNIKDGYGGMRESNMIFWMATVIYGVKSTKDLINIHFTDEEYKAYRSSLEYVYRVRNALHLIAKKKLDRVNFDVMPELSDRLGFKNTPRLPKERQLMSKLFESLHIIHRFSATMVQKFIRPYIHDEKNTKLLKENRFKKEIYIYEDKVYTSYNRKPLKMTGLLKELVSLPNSVKFFSTSYLYFVSRTMKKQQLTQSDKALVKQLLHKEHLFPVLRLLYNSQLFLSILPSAKKIMNQPQFDGYHRHPVDIHTLYAIKAVENIQNDSVKGVYDSLSDHEKFLLKTSILFHDIGKGRGRDHHEVSENIFRKFAKSIELDEHSTQVVSKIVRYHNMLNKVATTEDIYSQKVILNFVGLMEHELALKLLYVHTYADICAVNVSTYNSSTASLLKELYTNSILGFENKDLVKVSSRRVAKENAIKKTKEFKALPITLQKKISKIDSNYLFLKYKARDIIDIAKAALPIETMDYKIYNLDVLKISIIRATAINLGYILGKLQFLDIKSMGIYKLYDGKKFFQIEFGQNVDEEDIPFIKSILDDSTNMENKVQLKKPNIKENMQNI
jgi:[protein-PII] uridylyltransferase